VGLVYEKSLTKKRERERGDLICGSPSHSWVSLGSCVAAFVGPLIGAAFLRRYQALSGPY
jgi:hypothetical protein